MGFKIMTCVAAVLALCQTVAAQCFVKDGLCFQITEQEQSRVSVVDCMLKGDTVTIPSTVSFREKTYQVVEIGSLAFADNSTVCTIHVPATVVRMAVSSLSRCRRLREVKVDAGNPTLCDVDGVLHTGGRDTLLLYPQARDAAAYRVGANVRHIAPEAFVNCTRLTEIQLPEQLLSIGRAAFMGCTNLAQLTLPAGLRSIGGFAFYGCRKINNDLTSHLPHCEIDEKAFERR